jgi:hypothetical protein
MGSAPRRGSSARRENKPANNNQTSEFNVKSRPLKECEMAIFARTEQQKAPRRKSSSNNRKSNTSGGSNNRKRSFNITDLDDSVASRARRQVVKNQSDLSYSVSRSRSRDAKSKSRTGTTHTKNRSTFSDLNKKAVHFAESSFE